MKAELLNKDPNFFSHICFFFALITLMPVLFVLLFFIPQVHAQELLGFYTNLSGAEEVPPIDTNASGLAVFLYKNDTSQLTYLVNVTGLEKINQAALHNGSRGMNGEVTIHLSDERTKEDNKDAFLMINEQIKEYELLGPLLDKKVKDLIKIMSNESAYVNVYTDANPNGEIRGQLQMGQIQININGDITGLVVRDGIVRLTGISVKDGKIYHSPESNADFTPIRGGVGGSLVNVEDNLNGDILSGNQVNIWGDEKDDCDYGGDSDDGGDSDGGSLVNVEDNLNGDILSGNQVNIWGDEKDDCDYGGDSDDGGDSDGGSLVNVEDNLNGDILSGNQVNILGDKEDDNTSAYVEHVDGGVVGTVVQNALGDYNNSDYGKDSDDDGDSKDDDGKDSDDDGDSKDDDGKDSDDDGDSKDDDGKDSDDDGDSLTDKVKGLVS